MENYKTVKKMMKILDTIHSNDTHSSSNAMKIPQYAKQITQPLLSYMPPYLTATGKPELG